VWFRGGAAGIDGKPGGGRHFGPNGFDRNVRRYGPGSAWRAGASSRAWGTPAVGKADPIDRAGLADYAVSADDATLGSIGAFRLNPKRLDRVLGLGCSRRIPTRCVRVGSRGDLLAGAWGWCDVGRSRNAGDSLAIRSKSHRPEQDR
jgi:hypothetical protein